MERKSAMKGKNKSFLHFLGNETYMIWFGCPFRHIVGGHFYGDVTLAIAAAVVIMSRT